MIETRSLPGDRNGSVDRMAVAAGNRFYVTAYQEGTIRLSDDITLVVHTPGIYMLSPENGRLRIEASDPTHTQSSLSLTINDYDLKIMVPANQAPGSVFSLLYIMVVSATSYRKYKFFLSWQTEIVLDHPRCR